MFSVITPSYIISIIWIEFIYLLVVVGVLFSLAGICLSSIDLHICCHFLVVFSEQPRTLFQSFGLSLFIYLLVVVGVLFHLLGFARRLLICILQ